MLKGLITIGAAAAVLGLSGSAFAQSSDCTCVTPLQSGAAGQVLSARGQVLASQAGGLGPAAQGTKLALGSQLLTGPSSSADISVGSCTLAVASNAEVTVTPMGDSICVRVNEAGVVTTGQIGQSRNVPLLMFGGLSAGAAIGAAIGGGDDEASP